MPSMKKNEALAISLFPMFNILVCTLGVLIFIMSSVSVLSLGGGGGGGTITIVPDSTLCSPPAPKVPHYLVWDGASIIMLEKKDTVVIDSAMSEFRTFKESHDYLLRKIAGTETGRIFNSVKHNSKSEYFVILARARGFESLPDLKNFIKKEGIDIGYEPVNNNSPIKL